MAKRPVGPRLRLKHNSAVHAKGHDTAAITVFSERRNCVAASDFPGPPWSLPAIRDGDQSTTDQSMAVELVAANSIE
jgi:hypothetical protein